MATFTVTNLYDSGAGSLRDAIDQANALGDADTIEFDAGLSGTIDLLSALVLTQDVTIDGDTTNDNKADITLSGRDLNGILEITGGTTDVDLLSLTLTHGRSSQGAAVFADGASLDIVDSTISYNVGTGTGYTGAIFATGGLSDSLSINNSLLAYNTAVSDNTYGGAITTFVPTEIVNSTIHGNGAGTGGGIAVLLGSSFVLTSSTITNNTAFASTGDGGGGIFYNSGFNAWMYNSVIANNTAATGPADVRGYFTTIDNSVFSTTPSTPGNHAGNQYNVADVGLGALGDHGGTVWTREILPDSVLINAGGPTALTTDADGNARVVAGTVDAGATEFQLIVTTLDDVVDANDGELSLREALALANADAGADTITFASGLSGELTLALGALAISTSVSFNGDTDGDGKADITLDANHASRVFYVSGGTTDVALVSLTLTGGHDSNGGGAIAATGINSLDIVNTTISDSTARDGAGMWISYVGEVRIVNSTIMNNTATAFGGGIFASGSSLTIANGTVSGNTASDGHSGVGGGISVTTGSLGILNSTITQNEAHEVGGGVTIVSSVVLTVTNSVIAQNNAVTGPGSDVYDAYSAGNTITSYHSFFGSNVTVDSDVDGASTFNGGPALLGNLADNGGPVWTHAIFAGSPLIGAGDNSLLPPDDFDLDQDGNTAEDLSLDANGRPFAASTLDVGAAQFGGGLTVTSGDDSDTVSDFATDLTDGTGLTLREAIAHAATGETITFDAGLFQTFIDIDTELVLSRDIEINGDIDGDGRSDIFLEGNDRIFHVTGTGTDVALRALYMGYGFDTDGGIIATDLDTTLTIVNSILIGGHAYGKGGAVKLGGTGTFVNSIFLFNDADTGGAIYVQGGQALHLINTTMAINYAYAGGAIATGAGATVTIDQSTITQNHGYQYAGGIDLYDGTTLQVVNSVIAGNESYSGPGDISTSFGAASMYARSSVIGNGADVLSIDTNSSVIRTDDPGTAFMALGGPGTFAIVPTDGSPLIDAGDDSRVLLDVYDIDNDGNTTEVLPIDSRGAPRVAGAHVDIGAVEKLSLGDTGDVTEDNTPATGNVLGNDGPLDEVFGYDIGVVTFPGAFSSPGDNLEGAYGTLVMSATGAWTYTLHNTNNAVNALGASDTLTDTFTYFAGEGGSLFAELSQLTITIHGANDAPTSNNDTLAATEDTPVTFTAAQLLGNDNDPDTGTTLSIASVTAVSGGTVALNLDGTVTFTPLLDFNGPATFTYKTKDNGGAQSAAATATVNVSAVNDAPVITSNGGGATAAIGVAENSTAVTTVTSADPDGPARTYTLSGTDAALFSLDSATGALAFLTAHDFEAAPNDANHDNVYDVVVTSSDGTLADTQALAISVTNVVGHTIVGTNKANTIDSAKPAGNATTFEEDTIDGKAGNDTIKAGGGNDTVKGGDGIDKLNGGTGSDTVSYAGTSKGVELDLDGNKWETAFVDGVKDDKVKNFENITGGKSNDTLTGDSDANILKGGRGDDGLDGSKGNDSLDGGRGNDTIDGGRGSDLLTGRAGKDHFVFDSKLGPGNIDVIADFKHNHDKIVLDGDIFDVGPALGTGEFFAKAGAVKAKHANDHIIYNTTTGDLYYDADGKGGKAAIHFATLTDGSRTPPQHLDAADFLIV